MHSITVFTVSTVHGLLFQHYIMLPLWLWLTHGQSSLWPGFHALELFMVRPLHGGGSQTVAFELKVSVTSHQTQQTADFIDGS